MPHRDPELRAPLLEAILDHLPVGFAFLDPELRFVRVNDALAEIDGLPAAEHAGRSVDELVRRGLTTNPDVTALLRGALASAQPAGPVEIRAEAPWLPEARLARTSIVPVRASTRVAGLLVLAEDVTARRRTERALVASEERFRGIVESAIVGVSIVDRSGRFSYVNPWLATLLGYEPAELIGRRALDIVKSADHPRAETAMAARSAGDHGPARQWELVRKDGSSVWVLTTANPVHDAEGEPCGLVSIGMDITAQKELEAERAREEKFRELLVGALGHDLRQPMQAIVMAHAALAQTPLEDAPKKLVTTVGRAAKRMTALIDQMLAMVQARVAGGIAIERRDANFARLVDDAVRDVQAAHPDATIDRASSGCTDGRWDGDRLLQAVGNLLENAVRYRTAGTTVRVSVREVDRGVELAVTNRAPPIAAELVPVLFDPFRRGTRRRGGLGLGLYIVDQIVRAHGGAVAAESGGGEVTFRVSLPSGARRSERPPDDLAQPRREMGPMTAGRATRAARSPGAEE